MDVGQTSRCLVVTVTACFCSQQPCCNGWRGSPSAAANWVHSLVSCQTHETLGFCLLDQAPSTGTRPSHCNPEPGRSSLEALAELLSHCKMPFLSQGQPIPPPEPFQVPVRIGGNVQCGRLLKRAASVVLAEMLPGGAGQHAGWPYARGGHRVTAALGVSTTRPWRSSENTRHFTAQL